MPAKNLSGLEKVAVLLHSLPKDVMTKVLRHLDAKQAGKISSEMARVSGRPDLDEVLTTVVDEAAEVLQMAQERKQVEASAPMTATEASATRAHTKPRPTGKPGRTAPTSGGHVDLRIADDAEEPELRLIDPTAIEKDPVHALIGLPAELLARALESENARTISLLINRMEVGAAAQIYRRLTAAKRKEVSLRLTEETHVNEDLLRRVAQAVVRKCEALAAAKNGDATESGAKEKRIASLLRGLEREDRMEMITVLEGADADLAARVKALLYQFEDILRMQNNSVQKLLADTDTRSLALALSGAPPELHEKLLRNLSKRAQASLLEEIELNGTVAPAKVTEARVLIVQAIQRLDERGEMLLTD